MKKKIILIISIIIIIVGLLIYSFLNFSTEKEQNVDTRNEIFPEEEISEEQNFETEIKLFFKESTSGILVPEIRKVNSKELIANAYLYVLNLLIEGPLENKYINEIPKGTKVNDIKFEKGILFIDLSEEFLNGSGTNSIYSIVNTMCQFNEIEKIKITINGENKQELNEYFFKSEN